VYAAPLDHVVPCRVVSGHYNNTWSEKHHGLKEVVDKDGNVTFEYDIEKNSELAKNLKGHLMLSTGDIDNNVHPANTMRMADALIKANKRFDMLVTSGRAPRIRRSERLLQLGQVRLLLPPSPWSVRRQRRHVELNKEKEQVGDKKRR